jgi:four helix bundle protein
MGSRIGSSKFGKPVWILLCSYTGNLRISPAREQFGLAAQLRRAAVSIPSNIAEGAARKNTKELVQFLYIARGSLSELDTQLEICFRVGRLEKTVYDHLANKLEEMSMMLNGLIASLAKKI